MDTDIEAHSGPDPPLERKIDAQIQIAVRIPLFEFLSSLLRWFHDGLLSSQLCHVKVHILDFVSAWSSHFGTELTMSSSKPCQLRLTWLKNLPIGSLGSEDLVRYT